MKYAVVIEKAEGNYSAYVPDLPGCIATGVTVAEVESEIREAIAFHIEGADLYAVEFAFLALRMLASEHRDAMPHLHHAFAELADHLGHAARCRRIALNAMRDVQGAIHLGGIMDDKDVLSP